ncbi:Hypothetical predicted protein [Paramuricea clavata]|uniref:Uncharacterized protein n=1 Tax=Paramuricea clavata TaxID=317549 RepID=A0A7D9L8R5_PARCT|nr:Hypothetical predicted protein [Paramuricea clavata]
MAYVKHGSKRSAQNKKNSPLNTPVKESRSKMPRVSDTPMKKEEENPKKTINMEDIYEMMAAMSEKLKKLDKLDMIEERIKGIEDELKSVKHSVEFAHDEIEDIKKANERTVEIDKKTQERLIELEATNTKLLNSVIDLKARSMRYNLIFYNINEKEGENTTSLIHNILEEHLGIENASINVKIDRSHRMGSKKSDTKPRPIVAKFNYYQHREQARLNAKKLKGTGIAITEQFPEEIARIRKSLYPELKKAKS